MPARWKKTAASLLILIILTGALLPLTAVSVQASDTIFITVPYTATGNHLYTWDYPYSDSYFKESSAVFSRDLLKASLGFVISAFRGKEGVLENQYGTYLGGAGFSDIYTFGYNDYTAKDTLSGVIAHKTIDDFTLVAACPCGQGYGNEWSGNLWIGDEERHVGFNVAAQILEKELLDYIEREHLTGKLKLWLGGYSRAAATANLTAADMIESGRFDDVFAYLIAVPRTTKKPVNYPGIFNICGKFDPVPNVPMQTWGYYRYGTDYYTPAQESDTDYYLLSASADKICREVTNKSFHNNPQINYDLHLISEMLTVMCPTSKDYEEDLQDILMDTWVSRDMAHLATILSIAISRMNDLDAEQSNTRDAIIDYLSFMATENMSYNGIRRQVENGTWDGNEGTGYNMFYQHLPVIYLSWIFSDIDTDTLFSTSHMTRRFLLVGEMDIQLYQADQLIGTLYKNGKVEYEKGFSESESSYPMIFMEQDLNKNYILQIPMDRDYSLHLISPEDNYFYYYDVILTESNLLGTSSNIYVCNTGAGEYTLDLPARSSGLGAPEAITGNVSILENIEWEYSPIALMYDESAGGSSVAFSTLLRILTAAEIALFILMIICIVIAINHKKGSTREGRVYSNLFVIIPHTIVIIVFAALTFLFSLNMISAGMITMISLGFTMLAISLQALHGTIRNRKVWNMVFTMVLIVLAAVFLVMSQLRTYLNLKPAIYIPCIIALIIPSILSFFLPIKKKAGALTEGVDKDHPA